MHSEVFHRNLVVFIVMSHDIVAKESGQVEVSHFSTTRNQKTSTTSRNASERPIVSALLIDGGNFDAVKKSVNRLMNQNGLAVNDSLTVLNMEEIIGTKFDHKCYFRGDHDVDRDNANKDHWFQRKFQVSITSGMKDIKTNLGNVMRVEKGVDIALATRIIECAYGVGCRAGFQCDLIVVVTGDGDFRPAIDFALEKQNQQIKSNDDDNSPLFQLKIVTDRGSLSAKLNAHRLVDSRTNEIVLLDQLMLKSLVSINNSDGIESKSTLWNPLSISVDVEH